MNKEERRSAIWYQLLEAPTLQGGLKSRQKLLVAMTEEQQ